MRATRTDPDGIDQITEAASVRCYRGITARKGRGRCVQQSRETRGNRHCRTSHCVCGLGDARTPLGVDGFEAYVVASAAYILMVTVAPRGVEKYALRALPALLDRGDWGLARGLLHYGLRRTLMTSLIVGLAVGAWALSVRDFSDATRLAIVVSHAGNAAAPAGPAPWCHRRRHRVFRIDVWNVWRLCVDGKPRAGAAQGQSRIVSLNLDGTNAARYHTR